MLDCEGLIKKYCGENDLAEAVIIHSRCVMNKAIKLIIDKDVEIDIDFVKEACLLHDIGVFRCNAPQIGCFGDKPYIMHGVLGRELLEKEGLPSHALVCERHTGSGLTKNNIINQNLPLPHRDMLPISIEEKLVCYADKFFSKSGNLKEEKPIELIMRQMKKHGEDVLQRFEALHQLFGSR